MRRVNPIMLTALALAVSQAYAQAPANDSVGSYSYWAVPPGGSGPAPSYTVYTNGNTLLIKPGPPPESSGNLVTNRVGVDSGNIVGTVASPPATAVAFDWNGYVALAPQTSPALANAVGPIGYNLSISTQCIGYCGSVTNYKNGSIVGAATVNGLTLGLNRNNNLVYGQNSHYEGFWGGQPNNFTVYSSTTGSSNTARISTYPGENSVPAESYWTSGYVFFTNPGAPGTISAPFIAGTATSAATIATAGNFTASYSGQTLLGIGASNVAINVNFGNATWNGVFSGGPRTYYSTGGYSTYSGGAFNATGTISGANLSGIASGYGVASGAVTANFVGPTAQGIIGNYNVTFNRPSYYGGGTTTIKDAFWATGPGTVRPR
jgi:hypothetical protein